MATGYLAELSVQSGIQYFPTLPTFKTDQQSSKGTALGIRSGFALAIGLTSGHNVRNVAVMIRFRRQGDISAQRILEGAPRIQDLHRTKDTEGAG